MLWIHLQLTGLSFRIYGFPVSMDMNNIKHIRQDAQKLCALYNCIKRQDKKALKYGFTVL